MTLSLAITTFNRFELTIESFAQVIDDPRITDIIILDDCSTDGSYERLVKHFDGNSKVRVIQQALNRGMGLNKRDAIALSNCEWVIIFDSDNVIGKDYLDALYVQYKKDGDKLYGNIIYCPDFAKPTFDYRKYARNTYSKINPIPIKESMANCLMNTCNCIIHRDTYLQVYQHNEEMKGTDTIWFNYLWLKSGKGFYVVPGMQYFHRVHDGSGFMADVDYNMKQGEKIKQLIMQL